MTQSFYTDTMATDRKTLSKAPRLRAGTPVEKYYQEWLKGKRELPIKVRIEYADGTVMTRGHVS